MPRPQLPGTPRHAHGDDRRRSRSAAAAETLPPWLPLWLHVAASPLPRAMSQSRPVVAQPSKAAFPGGILQMRVGIPHDRRRRASCRKPRNEDAPRVKCQPVWDRLPVRLRLQVFELLSSSFEACDAWSAATTCERWSGMAASSPRRRMRAATHRQPHKIASTSLPGRRLWLICSRVHCSGDLSGRQRSSMVPWRNLPSVTWS